MSEHDQFSQKLTGRRRRFLRNEAGSSTVEFVLWVPLFAFLLMLTVDASFMYMNMTRMENAARDGARRVAMGQFGKVEIVAYVLSELPDHPYDVSADCSTTDYACVSVSRSVDSMTTFGVLFGILGNDFGAEVKMRLEPGVDLSAAQPVNASTCNVDYAPSMTAMLTTSSCMAA